MAGAISFPLLRSPYRFRVLGVVAVVLVLVLVLAFSGPRSDSGLEEPFEQKLAEDEAAALKAQLSAAKRQISSLRSDLEASQDQVTQLKAAMRENKSENKSGPRQQNNQQRKPDSDIAEDKKEQPNVAVVVPRKPGDPGAYQRQAGTCPAPKAPKKATIVVDELFDSIPFEDPDGGVWKQGFPISYSESEWSNENTLNVFIVPHSHNDPGWLKTFTQYFLDQTKFIISNIVSALLEDSSRTFVWAEISYFSVWWDEQSASTRESVKKLLNNGQLEIVTGGWVMTDEANSHYYAMIDQMIEGHQWLEQNVGIKPSSGWSIDPFGYSPTMAYLLKRMGLTGMVVQRVHYELKRVLAEKKHLEFGWRQEWDRDQQTDMMCHVMPFFSYDIPHTCGPDPSVCCQFDFARMGGRYSCPWPPQPVTIHSGNVAERARTLLDQYRKKAKLYKTNNVLIPLGDDFRYDKPNEVSDQYINYKMLIDYINSHPEMHASVRFGTLNQYFVSVAASARRSQTTFPSFSGDFFPYSDRHKQYWTGYFTSRPFYKHMDRVLEATLRAAEVLYSLALSQNVDYLSPRYRTLVEGRRALGVFQHHDGITGTAKDHVVLDYALKMQQGITTLQTLIADTAQALLIDDTMPSTAFLTADNEWVANNVLPETKVLSISRSPRSVVQYNPLGQERRETVMVLVDVPVAQVYDETAKAHVRAQVSIAWAEGTTHQPRSNVYELWFEAVVPPLGMKVFTISPGSQSSITTFSDVTVRNPTSSAAIAVEGFTLSIEASREPFTIENGYQLLRFDGGSGLLAAIKNKDSGSMTQLNMQFVTYGSQTHEPNSGAYLFIPPAPATPYVTNSRPLIRITKGELVSTVQVVMEQVTQVYRLFETEGPQGAAVEITNFVDIRAFSNKELAMRFKTDLGATEFYSDLNGFQYKKRRSFEKLPLGGNYYPLPAMLMMEDATRRVSFHTASALGCGSLARGEFEVMMDRILMQDDNRGLQQGVQDNRLTRLRFALTVEDISPTSSSGAAPAGTPSVFGHRTGERLSYPLVAMFGIANGPKLKPSFRPLSESLPCDVHLVNLRTLSVDKMEVALLLHRKGFACHLSNPPVTCSNTGGQLAIRKYFEQHIGISKTQPTSLSLMHDSDMKPNSKDQYELLPMELYAFRLSLI